jgi:hypothetical protein
MSEQTKQLKEFAEHIINVIDDKIVEPQSRNINKVIAEIDGLEFYCMNEAVQFLGITKARLARKLKVSRIIDTRSA